jgi:GxxExxY protein
MADIIYEKESYQIIGASLEVHKELGPGFLEAVYQEALTIEFSKQSIPFCREKELRLYYKNVSLQERYKVDFVCYDSIIIEVKALSALNSEHESQLINYLSATRLKLGILINCGERSLKYKRIIK